MLSSWDRDPGRPQHAVARVLCRPHRVPKAITPGWASLIQRDAPTHCICFTHYLEESWLRGICCQPSACKAARQEDISLTTSAALIPDLVRNHHAAISCHRPFLVVVIMRRADRCKAHYSCPSRRLHSRKNLPKSIEANEDGLQISCVLGPFQQKNVECLLRPQLRGPIPHPQFATGWQGRWRPPAHHTRGSGDGS